MNTSTVVEIIIVTVRGVLRVDAAGVLPLGRPGHVIHVVRSPVGILTLLPSRGQGSTSSSTPILSGHRGRQLFLGNVRGSGDRGRRRLGLSHDFPVVLVAPPLQRTRSHVQGGSIACLISSVITCGVVVVGDEGVIQLKMASHFRPRAPRPEDVVFVGQSPAVLLLGDVVQGQFDHAKEVVPGEPVLVEDLEDEFVLVGHDADDELFLPLGVERALLGLGQDGVNHFLAIQGDEIDAGIGVTSSEDVFLGQIVAGDHFESEQSGSLGASRRRHVADDASLRHYFVDGEVETKL